MIWEFHLWTWFFSSYYLPYNLFYSSIHSSCMCICGHLVHCSGMLPGLGPLLFHLESWNWRLDSLLQNERGGGGGVPVCVALTIYSGNNAYCAGASTGRVKDRGTHLLLGFSIIVVNDRFTGTIQSDEPAGAPAASYTLPLPYSPFPSLLQPTMQQSWDAAWGLRSQSDKWGLILGITFTDLLKCGCEERGGKDW